mmetsp:Transcript_19816/g.29328  ORF Transcript_19816/g.29328 Transcript_19816/m.29328 type:complete len:140 (+) Transcript_19816:340-759(+)
MTTQTQCEADDCPLPPRQSIDVCVCVALSSHQRGNTRRLRLPFVYGSAESGSPPSTVKHEGGGRVVCVVRKRKMRASEETCTTVLQAVVTSKDEGDNTKMDKREREGEREGDGPSARLLDTASYGKQLPATTMLYARID